MTRYQPALALLMLLWLTGCLKQTHFVAPKQEDITLALIPSVVSPDSPSLPLKLSAADGVAGVLPGQEMHIQQYCGGDAEKLLPEVGVKVLAALGGALGDYLTERMSRSLAKKIRQYTAQYEAQGQFDFYREGDAGQRDSPWRCLRLVREHAGQPVFEALVEIRTQDIRAQDESAQDKSVDALQMVLRRVYCNVPAVPADRRRIAVQLSLTADATWQQGNRGMQETLFEHRFPVVYCPRRGGPTVQYFLTGEGEPLKQDVDEPVKWDQVPRLPRVPMSVGFDGQLIGLGTVSLLATVTESGLPPKWLEKAYEIVSDNEDALSDLLKKEAEKLGEEEDDDGD